MTGADRTTVSQPAETSAPVRAADHGFREPRATACEGLMRFLGHEVTCGPSCGPTASFATKRRWSAYANRNTGNVTTSSIQRHDCSQPPVLRSGQSAHLPPDDATFADADGSELSHRSRTEIELSHVGAGVPPPGAAHGERGHQPCLAIPPGMSGQPA